MSVGIPGTPSAVKPHAQPCCILVGHDETLASAHRCRKVLTVRPTAPFSASRPSTITHKGSVPGRPQDHPPFAVQLGLDLGTRSRQS